MPDCQMCGKEYTRSGSRQKYCSQKCNQHHWDVNHYKNKKCKNCGKKFKCSYIKSFLLYCSEECKREKAKKRKQKRKITKICPTCKKKFKVTPKATKKFCSKHCRYQNPINRKRASKWMIKLNKLQKEEVKERMRNNNPSKDPKTVEKMMNTRRINGTLHVWAGKRGGNGQFTPEQILLATALGWPMEVPVTLAPSYLKKGTKRKYTTSKGYPTCYKIDIGNKKLKIGVEVDGALHKRKKNVLKDKKKEKALMDLGWKVLRFTNKEIMTNLSKVLFKIKKEIRTM